MGSTIPSRILHYAVQKRAEGTVLSFEDSAFSRLAFVLISGGSAAMLAVYYPNKA